MLFGCVVFQPNGLSTNIVEYLCQFNYLSWFSFLATASTGKMTHLPHSIVWLSAQNSSTLLSPNLFHLQSYGAHTAPGHKTENWLDPETPLGPSTPTSIHPPCPVGPKRAPQVHLLIVTCCRRPSLRFYKALPRLWLYSFTVSLHLHSSFPLQL